MRVLTAVGIVLAGYAFCSLPLAAKDLPQPEVQEELCELHVWGAGYPNRKMPARIEKHLRATNPPETFDRDNPLSNANTYDTAIRANKLPDAILLELMPENFTVRIIRHKEMIDQQVLKISKVKKPLSPPQADCYADLVITNNYGIFPSKRKAQPGIVTEVVASALAGRDRFITEIWMQKYTDGSTKRSKFSKKFDTPVYNIEPNTQQTVDMITAATERNLRQFVEFVNSKQR